MAIARLQSTSVAAASLAFASNVAASSLLLAGLRIGNNTHTFTSVTDSLGNTYAQVTGSPKSVGSGDHLLYLLWAINAGGAGANTVTQNVTGPGTQRMIIAEYSGVATSSPGDGSNGNTGTSTAPDSGGYSTANAADLLYSVMSIVSAGTISAGSTGGNGYTKRDDIDLKLAAEDVIVAATGTYSGAWTLAGSDSWGAIGAAFKAASGGAGVTYPALERGVNRGSNRGRNTGLCRSFVRRDRIFVPAYAVVGDLRVAA